MSYILNIETSTNICSVCLAQRGEVLALRESDEPNVHSRVIGLFVQEVMQKQGIEIRQLDAIAVSSGPGSYTGLRIGVSMAKGLCYSSAKPLIAIPTLDALAQNRLGITTDTAFIIPMIDARRMEVYAAVYKQDGEEVDAVQPHILDEHSFAEYLQQGQVVFRGDGALKASTLIEHPQAEFQTDVLPSASQMAELSYRYYQKQKFVNVAWFEPFYLKAFQAKVSKVKGLH